MSPAQRALALLRAGDAAEARLLLETEAPGHAAAIAMIGLGPRFADYAIGLLEDLPEPAPEAPCA
jgi:hypothetical protein